MLFRSERPYACTWEFEYGQVCRYAATTSGSLAAHRRSHRACEHGTATQSTCPGPDKARTCGLGKTLIRKGHSVAELHAVAASMHALIGPTWSSDVVEASKAMARAMQHRVPQSDPARPAWKPDSAFETPPSMDRTMVEFDGMYYHLDGMEDDVRKTLDLVNHGRVWRIRDVVAPLSVSHANLYQIWLRDGYSSYADLRNQLLSIFATEYGRDILGGASFEAVDRRLSEIVDNVLVALAGNGQVPSHGQDIRDFCTTTRV